MASSNSGTVRGLQRYTYDSRSPIRRSHRGGETWKSFLWWFKVSFTIFQVLGSNVLLILLDFLLYRQSDTVYILGCHNSCSTCGGVFKTNTAMSMEIFNPFHNRFGSKKIFTRIKVEICPEGTLCNFKALIIAKKYFYSIVTANGRCCELHLWLMNKFSDFAQLVFMDHSCNVGTPGFTPYRVIPGYTARCNPTQL